MIAVLGEAMRELQKDKGVKPTKVENWVVKLERTWNKI